MNRKELIKKLEKIEKLFNEIKQKLNSIEKTQDEIGDEILNHEEERENEKDCLDP